MFIIENYSLAVVFCFITMLCWGSWGNTQKLAGSRVWRYELYYWDYVIGVLLLSLLGAFTMGSVGELGRGFVDDLLQADASNLASALIGGVIFNLSNILLSASVSIAGMSVAFPLGVGLALVLGVFINYFNAPQGSPVFLFLGVLLVIVAIVFNAWAYKNMGKGGEQQKTKGIVIAIVAGIMMSFFFRFIASSMDLQNFECPEVGKMTPYTAMVIFSIGIFTSNFIFNTAAMRRPFVGTPTSYGDYFAGSFRLHAVGILGGIIWGIGNPFRLLATEKAGAAISYGLGQGATMVAAFWGVFIWKEFVGGPKINRTLLTCMFILFLSGIGLIIYAGL